MNDLIQQTSLQIIKDFSIEKEGAEKLGEEELLQLLADQVAYYLEHRLEFLLSTLYRMDVSEKKINAALSLDSTEPANITIAKLILERQKQRVFTKQFYKQAPIEDLEEGLEY